MSLPKTTKKRPSSATPRCTQSKPVPAGPPGVALKRSASLPSGVRKNKNSNDGRSSREVVSMDMLKEPAIAKSCLKHPQKEAEPKAPTTGTLIKRGEQLLLEVDSTLGHTVDQSCGSSNSESCPSEAQPNMKESPQKGQKSTARGQQSEDRSKELIRLRLHEYRKREQARGEVRDARLAHAENEALMQNLQHMGEANEWAEELGLSTRYQPYTCPQTGKVQCHIYEDDQFSKEMSMQFFERRYKTLQSRWTQLTLANTNRKKDTKSKDATSAPPAAYRARPETSMTREEQDELQARIRRVTLEMLALAARMRQQLDVLEPGPESENPFVIH